MRSPHPERRRAQPRLGWCLGCLLCAHWAASWVALAGPAPLPTLPLRWRAGAGARLQQTSKGPAGGSALLPAHCITESPPLVHAGANNATPLLDPTTLSQQPATSTAASLAAAAASAAGAGSDALALAAGERCGGGLDGSATACTACLSPCSAPCLRGEGGGVV